MKQYSVRDFKRLLEKNGYTLDRKSGDHLIYAKDGCAPISITATRMKSVVALRLIKEHSLKEK